MCSYTMWLYLLAGLLLGFALAYVLLELRYRARLHSLSKSYDVKRGKFVEQLVPYLQNFPYNPEDVRFIGAPVDFVVFDGLSEGRDVNVVFVEVKSGKSSLNEREKRIRDAVENKRVKYVVFRQ
jgi:predicted Holliday junction resolvase-like endonuclease